MEQQTLSLGLWVSGLSLGLWVCLWVSGLFGFSELCARWPLDQRPDDILPWKEHFWMWSRKC